MSTVTCPTNKHYMIKYNLTMQFASPICSKELLFLREETFSLREMEAHLTISSSQTIEHSQ
jgi:hypothetical protein